MTTRSLILVLLIFSFSQLSAQWNLISTAITEDLMDVHFADSLQGMAVGASGGVYVTSDGGFHWLDAGKTEDASLRMCYRLNADTLFAGGDFLYRSNDGGQTWTKYDDKYYPRDMVFNNTSSGIMVDAAKTWVTSDGGVSWNEILDQTNTLIIEGIYAIEPQQPVIIGNIDGGMGYSAYGYKKADDQNWYMLDVFSFPNSYAFTNAFFIDTNTCYLFANHNVQWIPGVENQQWKLTNFRLEPDPFTEEPTWYFDSEVINSQMPEYINSSFFIDALNGYAAGDSGRIYKTLDGGVNWTVDFDGEQPLKSMVFTNNHRAVAVGTRGTIVVMGTDYSGNPEQPDFANNSLLLQPNPAGEFTHVVANSDVDWITIYSLEGKRVKNIKMDRQVSNRIDVSDLPAGTYLVRTVNATRSIQSGLLQIVR